MYKEAADQGHMLSAQRLGEAYAQGHGGVSVDHELSYRYYTTAAEQGDVFSQYNAGVARRDGTGCAQSYEVAFEWWTKAAEQGWADANNELGLLYERGLFVGRDPLKAKTHYGLAIPQGSGMAPNNMGVLFSKGDGVDQDYAEARRLFTLAVARKESPSAPDNLRQMNEIIRHLCPLVDKRVILSDFANESDPLNGARGTATGFGHKTPFHWKPDFDVDLDSGAYTVKLDAARGPDGVLAELPEPRVVKCGKRHVKADRN
jgi:TPR repeat protein